MATLLQNIMKLNYGSFLFTKLKIFAFIIVLTPLSLLAQGWGFTAQLSYSGYCPGATAIALPAISGFPNKAQCEAVRQQVLAISISSGTCTVYYKCTPCEGSDINDQSNPGTLNLNNQYEGKPLFTPHNSKAFDDWAAGYKQQLESYGIKSILGNTITPHNYPQTGNTKFDAAYGKGASGFKAKSKPTSQPNTTKEKSEEEHYGVVSLLTSKEEQAKRDEWYNKKGFNNKPGNNVREISSNEGIKDLTGESENNGLELISSGWNKMTDKLPLNPLQKLYKSTAETFVENTFGTLTDETTKFNKYMMGESSEEPQGDLEISILKKTGKDVVYKNTIGAVIDGAAEKTSDKIYDYSKTKAIGYMGKRFGAKGSADTKMLIEVGEEVQKLWE